jgi:hypothetical protein
VAESSVALPPVTGRCTCQSDLTFMARDSTQSDPAPGSCIRLALIALRLADRGDIANDVIAHKIIELAKAGEREQRATLRVRVEYNCDSF